MLTTFLHHDIYTGRSIPRAVAELPPETRTLVEIVEMADGWNLCVPDDIDVQEHREALNRVLRYSLEERLHALCHAIS